MMKRIVFGILLTCYLGLPVQAQDPAVIPDPTTTVAAITTFAQLKVTIKKADKYQLAVLFADSGEMACQEVTTRSDGGWKRRTSTEAAGKLSDSDSAAIKKAFVELDFAKLEDVAPDNEPGSWITIKVSDGTEIHTYRAVLDSYGDDSERVKAFLQVVTKLVKQTLEK
jgi:hypothetical protein